MDKILPILIISFMWACILNICKKTASLQPNILPLVLSKVLLMGVIGVIFLFIFQTKNDIIEEIKNTDNTILCLLVIASFFEIIASFFYFYSLRNNDASWSVPMSEASVILISILISIYFLKEKLTIMRIIGILTILIGIFMVYQS